MAKTNLKPLLSLLLAKILPPTHAGPQVKNGLYRFHTVKERNGTFIDEEILLEIKDLSVTDGQIAAHLELLLDMVIDDMDLFTFLQCGGEHRIWRIRIEEAVVLSHPQYEIGTCRIG